MTLSTFELVILVAMAQFKMTAAAYNENRILSVHIPKGHWVIVASQQEHDYRAEYAYDILVCSIYRYTRVNEHPHCNLPAPRTAQAVLAIYGVNEDIAGEKMYQSAVIMTSAYLPSSFGETVRKADCSMDDSDGTRTFVVYTRIPPATLVNHFNDNYGRGHKGMVSVTITNGKRTYRTAILARQREPLDIVNKLIKWYDEIYFSQVSDLKPPVPLPECIVT